jgi:magnesium transporter
MLQRYAPPSGQQSTPVWIDLFDPTPEETAQVMKEFGIQVPTRESLQEIETSSRLKIEDSVIYLSMPLAIEDDAAGFQPIPLGFVLSSKLLITIRYRDIHGFSQVKPNLEANSASVFAALIAGMVDFIADMIEKLSGELSAVSAQVFGRYGAPPARGKDFTRALRNSLNIVGCAGNHLSRIRESLLGLQRIIGFVSKTAKDWLGTEPSNDLETARQDLVSLVDFEAHLSGKTQFLLDAILGFINTEQNDIFKVLTIVSVVGIPPTLIASMYGMNFHDMPELGWKYGYPYGLALIAFSILLPIVWFRRRGWW